MSLVQQSNIDPLRLVGSGEFLTFTIGDEEYGVDVLSVQEMRAYENVIKIASLFDHIPDYIKGLIKVRGVMTPIFDLRIKFGLRAIEYNQFTVVLILSRGNRTIGMVVDGVSDVVQLDPAQVRPAPALCENPAAQYSLALAVVQGRPIILADMEQMISASELALVDAASRAAA